MGTGQSHIRGQRAELPIADCRLPTFYPGMRVGLFGGTFDPPHAGHVEVSRVALRALALDQVWWLVSPHNPLKPHAPADLARRVGPGSRSLAVFRHGPRGGARVVSAAVAGRFRRRGGSGLGEERRGRQRKHAGSG